jgi:carbamoyl-phosphate synthase small subunit
MKAYLILEDGNVFTGTSIGSTRDMISEIVFNTSMAGYLEVLTDPSYAGQAVVMTYPLIGNYGICYNDMESLKPWVDGYIVREIARRPSNFRSENSIEEFLKENDIPGIAGIDTRALTKVLREKGTMNGMITTNENFVLEDVIKKLKQHSSERVVEKVTCKEKKKYLAKEYVERDAEKSRSGLKVCPYKKGNFKVALLDYGSKSNIADCLLKRGCDVTIYPALTKAEEILAENPDGIMLSNGPGDPKECVEIIAEIKKLYDSNTPIFAICLGHQLMALANGGDTKKLKYGHRGANHPVKNLKTGKVYISSQNHGYVVEKGTLSDDVAEISFVNANDGTVEGYNYKGKNVFTVQFHPEACAGPQDSEFLFDEFIQIMEVSK